MNPVLQQKLRLLDLCVADCRAHGDTMHLLWSSGSHLDDLGRPTDAEWRETKSVRAAIEAHLRRGGVEFVADERGITLCGDTALMQSSAPEGQRG